MCKKIRFVPWILVVTMVLSACAQEAVAPEPSSVLTVVETTSPVPTAAPSPTNGGTLRLSMRMPHTLNPLLNKDITVDRVLKLIFEPLVVLDESQKPVPNLAESIDFSDDGLTAFINLKQDVLWSDGTLMTADDVIFSLDTIEAAEQDTIYKDVVGNMESYTKLDEYTVEILYKQPYSGNMYNLCFPVIPAHYYAGEMDPASDVNMSPMGNGAFTFVSYSNKEEMVLVQNPQAFDGKPYIENISVLITSDDETDLYAFCQGIIDVANAEMSTWGRYREQKEANATEYISPYFEFLGFNHNNLMLFDKEIRKAIAYSIDVDTLVESIYLDHAIRAYTPMNQNSWLYEPQITKYDYDTQKAKEILTSKGFTEVGASGAAKRHINGIAQELVFTLIVNEENDARVKMAHIIAEDLKQVGIILNVEVLPYETYEARLRSGDFDMFLGGFYMSAIPDLRFAFHSAAIDDPLGANYFNYSNSTMDGLLVKAATATDEASFLQALNDVQKLIAEDLPCLSLLHRKTALLTDLRVQGELKPVANDMYANIHEWYLK